VGVSSSEVEVDKVEDTDAGAFAATTIDKDRAGLFHSDMLSQTL
jgi:hypothetical protein